MKKLLARALRRAANRIDPQPQPKPWWAQPTDVTSTATGTPVTINWR
jgi:hypothetical protein